MSGRHGIIRFPASRFVSWQGNHNLGLTPWRRPAQGLFSTFSCRGVRGEIKLQAWRQSSRTEESFNISTAGERRFAHSSPSFRHTYPPSAIYLSASSTTFEFTSLCGSHFSHLRSNISWYLLVENFATNPESQRWQPNSKAGSDAPQTHL